MRQGLCPLLLFVLCGAHSRAMASPPPRGRTLSSSSLSCQGTGIVIVIDRSKSMGARVYNTKIMPFVKSFVEAVEASYPTSVSVSSMPQTGVVVYPRYNGAGSADDKSGEAHTFAPVAYPSQLSSYGSTEGWTAIGIADDIAGKVTKSGEQKYCSDKLNKVRPYYPCGGFGFSPMWHGLMHAKEELFNVATNTPRFSEHTSQTIIVISDGVPSKSTGGPGGQYNRGTYLTLKEATAIKDLGAKVVGVGLGSHFTGPLGAGDCSPFDCNSNAGGTALFVGTNTAAGTVHFSAVDNSPLNCKDSRKGCGWDNAVTLDALVSGETSADRAGNMFALDADDLQTIVNDVLTAACEPLTESPPPPPPPPVPFPPPPPSPKPPPPPEPKPPPPPSPHPPPPPEPSPPPPSPSPPPPSPDPHSPSPPPPSPSPPPEPPATTSAAITHQVASAALAAQPATAAVPKPAPHPARAARAAAGPDGLCCHADHLLLL